MMEKIKDNNFSEIDINKDNKNLKSDNFDVLIYFRDILLQKINIKKISRSGWYTFNAPCCHHWKGERPDSRGRGNLFFDDSGWVYNCFNCGYKTRWKRNDLNLAKKTSNLLSWFGFSESEILSLRKILFKNKNDFIDNSLETKKEEKFDFQTWKESLNKINFQDLKKDLQIISLEEIIENGLEKKFQKEIEYVFNRGDHVLDYLNKIYIPKKPKGILFMPLFFGKDIYGLVQRNIFSFDNKIKYFNHNFDNLQIYNMDRILNENVVFIVEGVFDAMALDGVAILGNHATEKQIYLLESLGKKLCVFPDFDLAGMNLMKQAIDREWSVCLFPENLREDCKDASDLCKKFGKILFLELCYSCISDNQIKNKLFYKRIIENNRKFSKLSKE